MTGPERKALSEAWRKQQHSRNRHPVTRQEHEHECIGFEAGYRAALAREDTEPPAIETAARAVLDHAEYDDLHGHWRFEGKLLTDPDGAADDALTALEEALQ